MQRAALRLGGRHSLVPEYRPDRSNAMENRRTGLGRARAGRPLPDQGAARAVMTATLSRPDERAGHPSAAAISSIARRAGSPGRMTRSTSMSARPIAWSMS